MLGEERQGVPWREVAGCKKTWLQFGALLYHLMDQKEKKRKEKVGRAGLWGRVRGELLQVLRPCQHVPVGDCGLRLQPALGKPSNSGLWVVAP